MSFRRNAAALIGALSVSFAAGPSAAVPPPGLAPAAVDGLNGFACDVYAVLASEPGNVFFSPYSLSSALAMTAAGARGETARQMNATLHLDVFPGDPHAAFAGMNDRLEAIGKTKVVELTVANALWPQSGFDFNTEFESVVSDRYGAAFTPLDYVKNAERARDRVNRWVEKRTQGRIKDLIPPGAFGESTRLTLTNAIHFKGAWMREFDEKNTRPEPFHLADGGKADVPMMGRKASFPIYETPEFQALEMTYKGAEVSMLIVLPRDTDGLPALEARLTPEALRGWMAALKQREVDVLVPRFTMTESYSLVPHLAAMGMPLAFDARADFSGITESEPLCITGVLHKAFVEVNEKGTEAAAATGVIVGMTAMPPTGQPSVFRADRPFLFFIVDRRSKVALFAGRVADPR